MEKVKAIDVHTHPMTQSLGAKGHEWYMMGIKAYVAHREMTEEEVFGSFPTEEEYIRSYRESGVKGLPISPVWGWRELGEKPWPKIGKISGSGTVDDETAKELMRKGNDYLANLVKNNSDVFPTGWFAISPFRDKIALEEIERCKRDLDLLGIKFHPAVQAFFPNDKRFYPIWDLCQDLGCPVMFHLGYTGAGGMTPGGGGILPMTYTHPLYVDEVARDFPRLTIIGAHPAIPYEDEAILMWMHKPNFYRECSGYLPKYFPPQFVREINTRCQDKIMFGSEGIGTDFPPPKEAVRIHMEDMGYREGVVEKLLYKNAERILGVKV